MFNFRHGQLHLSGFQVRYMNFTLSFKFMQFRCQQTGTQMLGECREALFAIGKRTFDDQMTQVADGIYCNPEWIARAGVAGKTRLPVPESIR